MTTAPSAIDLLLQQDPETHTVEDITAIIDHYRNRRARWAQAEAEAQASGKKRVSTPRKPAAKGTPSAAPSVDDLLSSLGEL